MVQTSTWWQVLLWAGGFAFVPYTVANAMGFPFLSLERSFYNFLGLGIIVLLNLEVLLPRFYFQQKSLWYLLSAVSAVLLVTTLVYWSGPEWGRPMESPFHKAPREFMQRVTKMGSYFRMVGRIMPYFMALIGSSMVAIGEFARQKERETIQLEKEKLETEMKFLKSQINPHFLFNALNNIYTLTLIKSDAAPENLLRLSDMLRYMLYDCKADKVPLDAEVNYLRHYIQMKLLKDSGGMNVEVYLQDTYPNMEIAPLLFVPFVENAFKHSKIEDLDKGWIKIELITLEQEVRFCVQNSIPENGYTKDTVGGIGLDNVRRQLELMYPNQHFLHIEKKNDRFDVQLNIKVT